MLCPGQNQSKSLDGCRQRFKLTGYCLSSCYCRTVVFYDHNQVLGWGNLPPENPTLHVEAGCPFLSLLASMNLAL